MWNNRSWTNFSRVLAVLLGVVGSGLWSTSQAQATPFDELVRTSKKEMDGKAGNLIIALEWREQEVKAVLRAFKKAFPFVKEFTVERERQAEQFQRLLLEIRQGKIPHYDLLHVSTELWPDFKQEGLFVKPPFDYYQLVKTLPSGWDIIDSRVIDPQGYFMATTQLLALWLASEGQNAMESHGYRSFPWSPKSRKYPLAKGKYVAVCGVECVHKSEQAYFKLHAEILKLPGIH